MKKTHNPLKLAFVAIALVGAISEGNTAPVYKCTNHGKTEYSNEPCIGAQEIDVTPTQGIDRSTGQYRTGKNVQEEQMREAMNNALRPLTMLTKEQYAAEQRRYALPPSSKMRCRQLDNELPIQKDKAQNASRETKDVEEQQLYRIRMEYRRLDC